MQNLRAGAFEFVLVFMLAQLRISKGDLNCWLGIIYCASVDKKSRTSSSFHTFAYEMGLTRGLTRSFRADGVGDEAKRIASFFLLLVLAASLAPDVRVSGLPS